MTARKISAPNNSRKKKKNYTSDSDSDDGKKRFIRYIVAATFSLLNIIYSFRPANKRKTTAAVSYKEASEDEKTGSEDLIDVDYDEEPTPVEETDKSETIERIVGKRNGKKGVTGNPTTVYEVEENGDPNEGVEKLDKKFTETQYLIKWKGWSHIHNTYESEQSLKEQNVKGIKKLENYIKREKDIEMWRKYAGTEDIDYFECQQELHSELLKSYYNVERIIAEVEKADGSGIDYLCKWESLPYSDATWEDSSLVQKKCPDKIIEFQGRELSKNTPSKHCKAMKYRPKFHQLKSQPEFLGLDRGLTLRDYQMDGLNWLILTWCKENSVILADEMGLGKTIQTICFLYTLFKNHSMYGPFLCVVPLSTMTAWQREFTIWAPELNVVTYLGDVQSREIIRQYEWCTDDSSKNLKFNAILTTYEILLKDKTFLGCICWAALLVDEAHRLKNDDSLLYKALKDFNTNHRLLITGTPLQNSLKELWALLHFIMPVKFEIWDDFELNYGSTTDKGYAKLHKVLEPYILRRVKKDVEKSLPAKVEQILRVEMTSIQKQYYKWILTKNFNALRKGIKGSTTTFLNIVIELKKCCNHALLTRPNEYENQTNQEDVIQQLLKGSGKLVLLDKLLCRLRETGHRVLIFSQMVRMLDILAEYLQKRHFPFQRLDGSIKGELRKQALDHFNAENSTDFCFLLSTRAGGLGINLATADTVIIFDSDWNPQNDLQAQARAHRIGQKNQVNIYRLVTARSVEEEIVERAKQKMVLDHLVIQRMDTTGRTVLEKQNGPSSSTTQFNKDELSAILKFGAEELFKDEEDGDDELVCDIDEILRRAETRDEQPAMVGDELLSAFKVARFAFEEDKVAASPSKNVHNENGDGQDTRDWDDIIPANLRKAVEDEERHKEIEDLYLPPRRKTLQQINQSSEANEIRGRKRKKPTDDDDEEDEDDGSADGSEEDRPKKRGRPPVKEKFGGFNDAELRRFIRSYKKFPAPLKRLEAIACDAELQEKPLAELKKIGEMLHKRCITFLDEHTKENENDSANNSSTVKRRGARAGFSVKFGGVSFNAKTLMACVDELQPLDDIIPNSPDERMKWALGIKTRPANFDVEWGIEEDSRLLCGIYQFGIGSWEAMKMEASLQLADKIISNDNKKPQAKHLQSRAEYLLKIIRKNVELKKGVSKQNKKQRKQKEKKKDKVLENLDTEDISSCDELKSGSSKVKREKYKVSESDGTAVGVLTNDENSNGPSDRKKMKHSKESKKTKKKDTRPMHFTANNEPRALDVLGDLDPSIFNECKEKMRPVKKALKALDNPDQTQTNEEQISHTRACLLHIGNQIDTCLLEYKDPDKIKEWRSNLWYFVSKFTESDAKKLFKLYKMALKQAQKKNQNNHFPTSGNNNINSPLKDAKDNNNSVNNKFNNHKSAKDSFTVPGGGGSGTGGDLKDGKEKRSKKDKQKNSKDKSLIGDVKTEKYVGHEALNDLVKDESHSKRRLEEGECDFDSTDYKRLHGDRR